MYSIRHLYFMVSQTLVRIQPQQLGCSNTTCTFVVLNYFVFFYLFILIFSIFYFLNKIILTLLIMLMGFSEIKYRLSIIKMPTNNYKLCPPFFFNFTFFLSFPVILKIHFAHYLLVKILTEKTNKHNKNKIYL